VLALVLILVSKVAAAGSADAHALQGNKVTIELRGAELKDALNLLSKQSGIGIVVSGDVEGTVTANLNGIPFEKALEIILNSTGYGYSWEHGAVVVNPRRVVTKVVKVHYVDARKIAASLERFLSAEGSIKAVVEDPTEGVSGTGFSSKLIIKEREDNMADLLDLVDQLDAKPLQVHIEAKIIETTLGEDEKLGIRWNVSGSVTGAVVPTTFPFPKETSDDTRFSPTPDPGDQRLYIKAPFPEGELFPYASPEDFVFGKVSAGEFSMLLQMLAERRNTNLISSPSITTLDNKPAEILIGRQIPVALYERQKETGIMEIIGYDQQSVGVNLWVTPHVGEDSLITLDIRPETSNIVEFIGQYNERPVTSTRVARTQVMVRSNETVVIGGLIREIERKTDSRVPILADIPILGRLFRHKSREKAKVDLLVFITPRIIGD
jgi:general secretion pathway protein D